jgi:hypothetical protein
MVDRDACHADPHGRHHLSAHPRGGLRQAQRPDECGSVVAEGLDGVGGLAAGPCNPGVVEQDHRPVAASPLLLAQKQALVPVLVDTPARRRQPAPRRLGN